MRVPVLTATAYRRIAFGALLALAFIVVTGAAVRLTGSGLGCPQWPSCEPGSLTPRGESDHHDWIEFVNRTITGLVSVAVILAVLGAARRRPYRRELLLLALGLVAGVVGQIVLGGLTVLFDLWPPLVMAHFLVSMVLVATAVLLHHRAGEPDGERVAVVHGATRRLTRAVTACTAVVVATGTVVTASGPHAGDADVDRLGPDLPDVARVHGIAVVVLLAVLVVALTRLHRDAAPADVRRTATSLLVLLAVQGVLGYTQYFTGVPALLVGFHVALATAAWALAVQLFLGVSQRRRSVASAAWSPPSSPSSSDAPSRRPSPSPA
jgi:cytochrome c oxidase assembly protein subunit 15